MKQHWKFFASAAAALVWLWVSAALAVPWVRGAALHLPFAYVVFVVAGAALLPAFAYPYGALDANAEKALKAAGMQATMTSEEYSNTLTRSPECLFRLGRFERTGFMTTAQLLAKLK